MGQFCLIRAATGMIKRARESNKPGARDVCGARGENRAYILHKEYFRSFFTNAHTKNEVGVCLDIVVHSQNV